MDQPLIVGLLGAVVGSAASIVGVWIQGRFQAKRDRMRLVMELALEEYKSKIELIKISGRPATLPSITLFIHYHYELAKLLERGTLSEADLESLAKRTREVDAALDRIQEKPRGAPGPARTTSP